MVKRLEPQTITVTVCSEFTVYVWIRNLPDPMEAFDFGVKWDPMMMEHVSHGNQVEGNGWTIITETVNEGLGFYMLEADMGDGDQWTADAPWATITFHCLGEGTSILEVETIDTIWVRLSTGELIGIFPDEFDSTVTQVEPAPVGGITTPINKLEIVTPFLALAGLIAVISTVFVIRRREA